MNDLNGVINVLKPPGMTSHDVVSYIRKITGLKKVGHTGTLDPDAAGVLPVCLGKATRAVEYITEGYKKYRAEMKLGVTTNTGDSSGDVIARSTWQDSIDIADFSSIVNDIIKRFKGTIEQTPPMFSAIKVNGKKLYELARKGETIERKPRTVKVHDIQIIDFSTDEGLVMLDVTCSKGTYIRVLCEDIGNALGCGAHMTFLIRKAVSEFDISDALTLEQIEELIQVNELSQAVMTVSSVFHDKPVINITDSSEQSKLLNGVRISLPNNKSIDNTEDCLASVYFDSDFIGLARFFIGSGKIDIKMHKLFI